MSRKSRIPRSVSELLLALDHHQHLLRENLHGLRQDPAHLKIVVSELRNLVCMSSGTEGLLWRLVDELGISDEINLLEGGTVNRDHPLAKNMQFWTVSLKRKSFHPAGPSPKPISLRHIIKEYEAIFLPSVKDRVITHEILISAISNQLGGSHESEGLDYDVVRLGQLLINQREAYFQTLAFDAELVLQVGERVLDYAEKNRNYQRAPRSSDKGDSSLVLRFHLKRQLASRVHLLTLSSEISEVEISCYAGPQSTVFVPSRRDEQMSELTAPYPEDWGLGEDAVFVLSYSSAARRVRTITNDVASSESDCELGWVDAREIELSTSEDSSQFVGIRWIMTYEQLIDSKKAGDISRLSPDGRELFLNEPRSGPFPN